MSVYGGGGVRVCVWVGVRGGCGCVLCVCVCVGGGCTYVEQIPIIPCVLYENLHSEEHFNPFIYFS